MMFATLKHAALNLYRRNPGADELRLLVALMSTAGDGDRLRLDTRLVTGINPWIKPMKFAASFSLYFVTFGWLLSYLPRPSRAVTIISWVTSLCLLLECRC